MTFALVALPWYILVAIETKGQFVQGFLMTHNVNRFVNTVNLHSGSYWFYPAVLDSGHHTLVDLLGARVVVCVQNRQGDKETRRQGDKETRRQGDKETDEPTVSLSPCLLVSLSPCLCGAASS